MGEGEREGGRDLIKYLRRFHFILKPKMIRYVSHLPLIKKIPHRPRVPRAYTMHARGLITAPVSQTPSVPPRIGSLRNCQGGRYVARDFLGVYSVSSVCLSLSLSSIYSCRYLYLYYAQLNSFLTVKSKRKMEPVFGIRNYANIFHATLFSRLLHRLPRPRPFFPFFPTHKRRFAKGLLN